jgi:3-methyladenine DNA glycosylase AlkD
MTLRLPSGKPRARSGRAAGATQARGFAQAAAEARRELERLAHPAGTFDASRYFRGADDLGFYNVGTGAMRSLARSIHGAHQDDWSIDDAMAFAERLIVDRHLEAKSIGIEVVARYRRDFTPRQLTAWKRWLSRNYSANWATTDGICAYLIGPLLVRYPPLGARMHIWARDRNMWVRRAAAVSLIPSVRLGLANDLSYEIARRLHGDQEDLIQKAVGWLLRETGKKDPARLERYLRANGPSIPRTTVRYAIERFPARTRRALLSETRAGRLDWGVRDPINHRSR